MKRQLIFFLLVVLVMTDCKISRQEDSLSAEVGDIQPDPKLDGTSFMICGKDDRILQYFNLGHGLQIEGEKKALKRNLMTRLQDFAFKEDGYYRVRFVVNCKGETGRFRLLASDRNFREIKPDKDTKDRLLEACRGIKGWKVLTQQEVPRDYYQYITFKILDHRIVEILP